MLNKAYLFIKWFILPKGSYGLEPGMTETNIFTKIGRPLSRHNCTICNKVYYSYSKKPQKVCLRWSCYYKFNTRRMTEDAKRSQKTQEAGRYDVAEGHTTNKDKTEKNGRKKSKNILTRLLTPKTVQQCVGLHGEVPPSPFLETKEATKYV